MDNIGTFKDIRMYWFRDSHMCCIRTCYHLNLSMSVIKFHNFTYDPRSPCIGGKLRRWAAPCAPRVLLARLCECCAKAAEDFRQNVGLPSGSRWNLGVRTPIPLKMAEKTGALLCRCLGSRWQIHVLEQLGFGYGHVGSGGQGGGSLTCSQGCFQAQFAFFIT